MPKAVDKDNVFGIITMENKIKIRIKFKKYGDMKFIGHLDVMRYFQKLLRRAKIDCAYSEGFNPHQIMSFANPLGVGIESKAEYMDLTLNSITTCEDIRDRLNAQNAKGFEISEVAVLPEGTGKAMATIDAADYKVVFHDPDKALFSDDDCAAFLLQDKIEIIKKTKKGEKTMDLKEGIHELHKNPDNSIFMKVSAGSRLNIRPEQVMGAFFDHKGIDPESLPYGIVRLEQYDEEGKTLI